MVRISRARESGDTTPEHHGTERDVETADDRAAERPEQIQQIQQIQQPEQPERPEQIQ
ncbi:hypothetical protein ACFVXC_41970 [Streptomyces sp. NPDC058257]|uniref:hypothetical protein n=1 Tax=Streptomyces sp. NPDC058257 TaxID=3346409 RepID=UPI0036E2579A